MLSGMTIDSKCKKGFAASSRADRHREVALLHFLFASQTALRFVVPKEVFATAFFLYRFFDPL